jgi:hypothetical protein
MINEDIIQVKATQVKSKQDIENYLQGDFIKTMLISVGTFFKKDEETQGVEHQGK